MTASDKFYLAAERRIEWLTFGLGMAGAIFTSLRWGWRAGAGVAAGALLMWLNFRWLKQGVGALVIFSTSYPGQDLPRVPRMTYVKFFGRFALLLVAAYVILSRSTLPGVAVLAGLFALVAAVMIELLFELALGKHGTETHT